jgi:hypothetical protein
MLMNVCISEQNDAYLGEIWVSDRTALNLLKEMVAQGILEVADPSRRARTYQLSEVYRKFIGSLSAVDEH